MIFIRNLSWWSKKWFSYKTRIYFPGEFFAGYGLFARVQSNFTFLFFSTTWNFLLTFYRNRQLHSLLSIKGNSDKLNFRLVEPISPGPLICINKPLFFIRMSGTLDKWSHFFETLIDMFSSQWNIFLFISCTWKFGFAMIWRVKWVLKKLHTEKWYCLLWLETFPKSHLRLLTPAPIILSYQVASVKFFIKESRT